MPSSQKVKAPKETLGVHSVDSQCRLAKVSADKSGLILRALSCVDIESRTVDEKVTLPPLDPETKSKTVCIASDRTDILVGIPQISGNAELRSRARVIERMGVQDPAAYRLGYQELSETATGPRRIMAVAFPNSHIADLAGLMPDEKARPHAIVSAVLARLTAFHHSVGEENMDAGVLCVDETSTVLAMLSKGRPAIIRNFQIGFNNVLTCIQRGFGVDRETAQTITLDGAFDIAEAFSDAMTPLVRQVILSRDFVERHEGVTLKTIHICAPPMIMENLAAEIREAIDVETAPWSPIDGLRLRKKATSPSTCTEPCTEAWRYTAALGAAIGCLQEGRMGK